MDLRDRVFIDTNELFPFTIMDVLLTLSDNQVFTWVWTDELLAEWERVIVREKHRSTGSARSVTNAVRAGFAASRIDPADYRHLVDETLSPDPDDRAHVAACLGGRVDVLVTRDSAGFPTGVLGEAGVRVLTADQYLLDLLRRRPRAVVDSFIATAGARKRPPITPCELTERINKAGAPRFAAAINSRLGCPEHLS